MAKGRPVVLVGLDLGTSKTAVVVARAGSASIELVGAGESPSVGMQRGTVVDPGTAAKSVRHALEKAGGVSGKQVARVYASYSGSDVTVRDCFITDATHTSGTVIKAGQGAAYPEYRLEGVLQGEKVLHLILPKNLQGGHVAGGKLKARAIVVGSGCIKNVTESVRLAGLEVCEVVYGPLVGAEALLNRVEREFGTILADMGAGITSVSIFDRGMIRNTVVIPVGGEHLVGDLAIGLRTSLSRAEEILKNTSIEIGIVDKSGGFNGSADSVGEENGEAYGSLARSIVESRLDEILELVAGALESFNYSGLLLGGAILSGGVSCLSGLVQKVENRLGVQVKVGRAVTEGIDLGPAFTNALGLVMYGYRCFCEEDSGLKNSPAQGGPVGKFLGWFHNHCFKV